MLRCHLIVISMSRIRTKPMFASITALILGTMVLFQAASVHAIARGEPEPGIKPVTYPVTFAVRQVSGKIYQRIFGKKIGLPGVDLTAVNALTGEKYVIQTNSQGNYSLYVKAGIYEITPSLPGFVFAPKSLKLRVVWNDSGKDFFAKKVK